MANPDAHPIYRELRQYREDAGLSRHTLAEQLDMTWFTSGAHERGERDLTLTTLTHYAARYGLEVALRPADANEPDDFQRGWTAAVEAMCRGVGIRTDGSNLSGQKG